MALEPRRYQLHAILVSFPGVKKVYFQRPTNNKLEYPCIMYVLDDVDTLYADNNPYLHNKRYQVTVIDENPDSEIPDMVANLPKSRFDRFFIADNLNHTVYNLFF